MSLFWSYGNAHWSCKIQCSIVPNPLENKKNNQVSLVYYSILSSSWIKKESKLCYFPKNMLEHKQFKNMEFTWSPGTGTSVSPLTTSWTSIRSCLSSRRVSEGAIHRGRRPRWITPSEVMESSLWWNQDKEKTESSRILQHFLRQKFSFVTKLIAMLL